SVILLKFCKLLVSHSTKFFEGVICQFPQFRFFRRKMAAHLGQDLDQQFPVASVVNAHEIGLVKGEILHITSPFLRSFWALSFCVWFWVWPAAVPLRISSSLVPADLCLAALWGRCC